MRIPDFEQLIAEEEEKCREVIVHYSKLTGYYYVEERSHDKLKLSRRKQK